jgi:hypothetical protein
MEEDMSDNEPKRGTPDPARLEAMRSLPKEVLDTLTKEEVQTFLQEEIWPDSLREKLKDYLVEEGN